MFKRIFNAIGIALQNTPLQFFPRKGVVDKNALQAYNLELTIPPYTLVADQFKIKTDLLTKLHCVDNRLQDERVANKKGRAKWLTDHYEQVYHLQAKPSADRSVEVYYNALGLAYTKQLTSFGRN